MQSTSRSGLAEEVRSKLFTKYDLKGEFSVLVPPKLNKELVTALTSSVVKRDEYQSKSQMQVGVCLQAFSSGLSCLLKNDISQSFAEDARLALTFLSDGIYLLSDHHYHLPLARRAFTKPSMNLIGKNAADSAVIDEFLFGQDFSQTLKAAQICEKAGREAVKSTPLPGKKSLQPARLQTAVRRTRPYTSEAAGNRKAPVRAYPARRSGASQYKSRRHRSQSRSRSRQRRRRCSLSRSP